MQAITIRGLGTYLPERRVTNLELEARLPVPAGWIARATGIHERRAVGADETTISMAAAASRAALHMANLDVVQIDGIIGASAVPQQAIPCTAALLQRALGAPEGRSACFDVNVTCLSFLVALQTAACYIESGLLNNVLVFSSEISSCAINWAEPESAVLFGDGAAAVIVSRSAADEPGRLWHMALETHSSGADLTRVLGGGTLHHPNNPATTSAINLFSMQGPAVFKQAVRLTEPFLDRFFATLGWERTSVDLVIPHQASGHAVAQLSRRLGFRPEQVFINLPERGNCIAASLPLALAEAVAAGRLRRGDRAVLVGTGAGLTLGALALTF